MSGGVCLRIADANAIKDIGKIVFSVGDESLESKILAQIQIIAAVKIILGRAAVKLEYFAPGFGLLRE